MEPGQRRTQLLDKAAQLFGENGYHNTSISDIVRAANVARGTFYLYFPNKKKLFEELVDSLILKMSSCIQTVEVHDGAPSPRIQLVDNISRIFLLLCEQRQLLSILLKGAVGLDDDIDAKLHDFYSEVLSSIRLSLVLGQKMGLVRECDSDVASLAALGAMKQLLQSLLDTGDYPEHEKQVRNMATQILDIFSRGVLENGSRLP